jgi:hypothetical protein
MYWPFAVIIVVGRFCQLGHAQVEDVRSTLRIRSPLCTGTDRK